MTNVEGKKFNNSLEINGKKIERLLIKNAEEVNNLEKANGSKAEKIFKKVIMCAFSQQKTPESERMLEEAILRLKQRQVNLKSEIKSVVLTEHSQKLFSNLIEKFNTEVAVVTSNIQLVNASPQNINLSNKEQLKSLMGLGTFTLESSLEMSYYVQDTMIKFEGKIQPSLKRESENLEKNIEQLAVVMEKTYQYCESHGIDLGKRPEILIKILKNIESKKDNKLEKSNELPNKITPEENNGDIKQREQKVQKEELTVSTLPDKLKVSEIVKELLSKVLVQVKESQSLKVGPLNDTTINLPKLFVPLLVENILKVIDEVVQIQKPQVLIRDLAIMLREPSILKEIDMSSENAIVPREVKKAIGNKIVKMFRRFGIKNELKELIEIVGKYVYLNKKAEKKERLKAKAEELVYKIVKRVSNSYGVEEIENAFKAKNGTGDQAENSEKKILSPLPGAPEPIKERVINAELTLNPFELSVVLLTYAAFIVSDKKKKELDSNYVANRDPKNLEEVDMTKVQPLKNV